MLNRFLTICFFFVFSLSSSIQVLWAQNTEAGEGLSLGLAVPTPEIGQPYIAERIGDWNLRCIRTRDGNDPCELTQIIINDRNEPVAEIALFKLPSGQPAVAAANIVVPLKTLLNIPLTISFGPETTKKYPYSFCSSVGCIARIGLTDDDIALMKKGLVAQIIIAHLSLPNENVIFELSLKGFTAAYKKATVIQN